MRLPVITALCCCMMILFSQAALAAKPSVVTKLEGDASVVRCTPRSNWLAAWNQVGNEYKLMVINADNGEKREIATAANPGGMCWIPGKNILLYTFAFYQDKLKLNTVTYKTYNVDTKEDKKVGEMKDLFEMYTLDPIAAEDGSKAMQMTINTESLPSFNLYLTGVNQVVPRVARANIGSDYDLSSDGYSVFWHLHDADTGDFYIAEWSLEGGEYRNLYTFSKDKDPADDHALFKVESASKQAATTVYAEGRPTLQLCIYNFANKDNPQVLTVDLQPNEDLIYFDWKDRGNTIYALVNDKKQKMFKIIEIEPYTKARRELLSTSDFISLIDYSSGKDTYYYSVLDNRDSRKVSTQIMRLQATD
ncbi:MAG: hypothetical protein H7A35_16435 [Planctomycetales bacterium]|nr:hypothetical protein [bacterium]UNM08415.1 MAG: hypothetical protein H7A35_16435 [Planctomycetales bacterium]